MIYWAHKKEDGALQFIFRSKVQVQLCFGNLKPSEGEIVQVEVNEVIKK